MYAVPVGDVGSEGDAHHSQSDGLATQSAPSVSAAAAAAASDVIRIDVLLGSVASMRSEATAASTDDQRRSRFQSDGGSLRRLLSPEVMHSKF